MTSQDIHRIFVKAAIEAVKQGSSAKQLADYLADAAAGMKINASFGLNGEVLLQTLSEECR